MKQSKSIIKKMLIIANPVAGKMKVGENFDDIQQLFSDAGFESEIFFTKKEGDATLLTKKHYMNKDLIVCAGGDGTLNEVITGVAKYNLNVPVGYLPAGTTNDLASSLSIPTNLLQATKFIINNDPKEYDIGYFNEKLYFDYVASFGAFSKTAYATPQWFKNKLGYFAYLLSSVTMLDSLKPYELTVYIDKEKIEGKFIFGGISNSTSVGGIIDLTDKTQFDDGKFEVLLVKYPESLSEGAAVLDALINKNIDNQNVYLFHGSDIELHFKEKTAWTLDGEYGGEYEKANIKVLNKKIKIIY